MLSAERHQKILTLLEQKKTATIEDCTVLLDVSANTVRRDLALLESNGMLKRIQGGAVALDLDRRILPVQQRGSLLEAEKRAIGREAAKLVRPHSSIILDAGSTTLELARSLDNLEDLTVITNSLDVCNLLAAQRFSSILLSGGVLLDTTHSFVGSPAEKFFGSIHADIFFTAAKGVDLERGLTIANIHEGPVKQKMFKAADQVVLVTDHSKFGREALSHYGTLDQIDVVVTDSGLDPAIAERLRDKGIRVILAEAEAD